jgi:hypothetical protein
MRHQAAIRLNVRFLLAPAVAAALFNDHNIINIFEYK